VVVDKPMTATSQECQDVIKASKQSDALLTVFQNRRFDGNFLTVKQIIEKNLLGPICRFESRYERYRPAIKDNAWRELADPADAGGLLYDLGSHIIDQALQLFGTPISVYAEIDKKRPGAQVDDDIFIALEFPQSIRAHLWASMLAKIPGPRFRINGLAGSYEKYGFDPQEDALRAGTLPLDRDWGKEPEDSWGLISTSINGQEQESKYEPLPGCYQRFYSQLRDAISNNTIPPVLPEESLLMMQVIEVCLRSAKTRQVIHFEN
jgi:predicted dehydrogenase